MADFIEEDLKKAFEVIQAVCQAQLKEEIVSISSIEFITRNDEEEKALEVSRPEFKIMGDEGARKHRYKRSVCRLVGGYLFCS